MQNNQSEVIELRIENGSNYVYILWVLIMFITFNCYIDKYQQ